MPQIIIRPRDGGTGNRTADQNAVTENKVLVIVDQHQIEIYTDADADEKLASE